MSSEQEKNKDDNGILKQQQNDELFKKGENEGNEQKKSKKQQKKKKSSESKSSKSRSKSRSKRRSKSKKSKKDKKKKHKSSSSSRSSSRRRHKKKKRSKSRSRRRDRERRRRSKSYSSKKSDKKSRKDKFQWDSPPKDEVEQKQQQQSTNIVKAQPETTVASNNPLGLGLTGLGLLSVPQNPLQAAPATQALGALNPLNQTQEMLKQMQLVTIMKNLQNQNANSEKKLYIGNLPPNITPQTLCDVLNSALQKMNVNTNPGNSVINSWISPDGHYGFVEFRTSEETTNGFALNNVAIFGQPLKVGRPRTYQQQPNALASMNPLGGMSEIPGMGILPGGLGLPGGLPGVGAGLGNPLLGQVNPAAAMMNPLGLGLGGQFGGLGGIGGLGLGGVGGLSANALQSGLLSQQAGLGQMLNPLGVQQTIEQTVPTIQKVQPPSRVLVLKNMVSTHELEIDEEYNDILEEVKEECEKYGKVISVKIPRPVQGKTVQGLGKVFVEFTTIDQAKEARKNLSGRTFADNTVECSYHDEKMYAQENFNDPA